MSSLAINSLMKNLHNFGATPTKPPPIIERTGGGGGGSFHHSHSSGGSKKHSIALTALTLLSFLFFLNILQNCLQDQMDQMDTQQQVVILQARLQKLRDAGVTAQKRKGELHIIPDNTSLIRTTPRQDFNDYKLKNQSPIAVKLKTVKGHN